MAEGAEHAIQTKDRDFAKLEHGCEHYRRRCKIRAPCCDRVFPCRHCHNEFTSSLSNLKDHHELVRHDVKRVVCSVCDTEQEAAQVCSKCGVNMGEYFCGTCKFYDDQTEKEQFHCGECGICRVGGRENFFHCPKCGSCYVMSLRDNHVCMENSMKRHCPVCYEYLFDSMKGTTILKCGHTIHMDCAKEMADQNQYRCPICLKTVMEKSEDWRMLDAEIAETVMPKEYQYKVTILCNDCNKAGHVPFHIFGLKCSECRSYNTRRISAADHQQDDSGESSTCGPRTT